MSSSDKVTQVRGSQSATDAKAAVAAAAPEATGASESDAEVNDVAAASGVVDGTAPKVAAPKVAAGGRYSDAVVAAMTEDQLWTAVSAGLLTSGQMARALQQFGLEATTPKGYQALLLKHALEGSMAARVTAQADTAAADETEAAAAIAQAQEIRLARLASLQAQAV